MQLTRGAQRAGAILLALLSLLLAYFGLVHWWLVAPLQQMAEEEHLLQASYQRFAALEAQREVMQARLGAVREQPLHSDSLLSGTEPQAGSDVGALRTRAERAGGPASGGRSVSLARRGRRRTRAGDV